MTSMDLVTISSSSESNIQAAPFRKRKIIGRPFLRQGITPKPTASLMNKALMVIGSAVSPELFFRQLELGAWVRGSGI